MDEHIPYRPCNAAEGVAFNSAWCFRCTRDVKADDGDGCEILARTFILDENDPAYPVEWREDGPEGPRCTAFEPIDAQDQPRCPLTQEMFA